MMADRAKRKSTCRRISAIVLGVCAGVLVAGLAPPAHAQMCNPVEAAKLLADDGGAQNRLGFSVSISGDTAVVGAWADDDNGFSSGSAYIFTRSGGVWTQQAKLLPSDARVIQRFGWSVSISADGDTALIGAVWDDDNGDFSGAAYIFTRSGGVWTQQAKLLPSDGATDDLFGNSVSITDDGDTVLIGARGDGGGFFFGSAYVFTRSFGPWVQLAKLLPADLDLGDAFGTSVSISGDTAVIGAPGDDDNGEQSGSAYVFTQSGIFWTQQAKLLPSDGATADGFGTSISISGDGDTALIGAFFDDDNGNDSGSAYVFTRSGLIWSEQAKLLADDGAEVDQFGASVSIDGDTALIGVRLDDDNGFASGSAYIFTRSGGVWTQQAKILADDAAAGDEFGASVSIDGDTALVGAPGDDDNGSSSGSAYVIDLNCPTACPADLAEPFGVLNFSDVIAFLTAFGAMDPAADLAPPIGVFDFSDVVAFLASFGAGCP